MCNNANGKTTFNIENIGNIGADKKDDGAMTTQKVTKRTKNGTTVIMNQNAREITNIEHLDTLIL